MALQLITCEDARAKGLRSFYTGIPCKHGHVAERCTVSRNCRECERDRARRDAKPPEPMPLSVITRQQAIDRGRRFYFDGKRCQRNHLSPRYASNGSCVACLRERWARIRTSTRREYVP